MKQRWIQLSLLLLLIFVIQACSPEVAKYNKMARKGTIEEKDSAAMFFYNRGDYSKSTFLFEELLGVYRGDIRARDILFYYANSKYKEEFFVMAAYYYEQYVTQYPSSERVEDCSFMSAFCYYKQADPYYLDQRFTQKAIDRLQLFMNAYPATERKTECNLLVNELRERLAVKAFEQAKLYYKIENYKGAVRAFTVMNQEFPDSKYREESEYMLFRSSVGLADDSIDKRKINRYLDAAELYQKFIDKFPSSTYLQDAEELYLRSQRSLNRFKAKDTKS